MTNWRPTDPDQYRDVNTIWNFANRSPKRTLQQQLAIEWRSSRDSARTPVQWSAEKNAGFTTGESTWMDINSNYTEINVAQQLDDPDSVLNFYKKAIQLRKNLSCVRHGVYLQYRPLSKTQYLYSMEDEKQKILVVCSFAKKAVPFRAPKVFDISKGQLILCSVTEPAAGTLTPYETRVYLWNK